MKFISLFTKAPNYKRFSYEPRYFDAKAEERKEREERIKREIESERGQKQTDEEATDYRKRMTGAFHNARRRSQASPSTLQSSLIRLGVLLFLSLFIMAFLTWGKVALYGFLLFVPVYIYLKFKK